MSGQRERNVVEAIQIEIELKIALAFSNIVGLLHLKIEYIYIANLYTLSSQLDRSIYNSE